MSEFEDNLWRDVVQQHGDDLDQITWPPPRRRRPRPRALAGTGAALAAVAGVLLLVLGGAGTSPAYAVTTNHDGSVTLTINRLQGIQGANLKLSRLGVRAMAVQVPAACRAAISVARFNPRRIPAGKTLVIAAWRAGRDVHLWSARIGQAGAPECLPSGHPLTAIKGPPPVPGVAARCTVSGPAVPPPLPPGLSVGSGSTGTSTRTGTAQSPTGTTETSATQTATTEGTGTGTNQSTGTGTGTTESTGTGTGTTPSTGAGTGTTGGAAANRPLPMVAIPCGFQQRVHGTPEQLRRALAFAQAARKKFGKVCSITIGPPQQQTVPSNPASRPSPGRIVRCETPAGK